MINSHLYYSKFGSNASRILKEMDSLIDNRIVDEMRVYAVMRSSEEPPYELLDKGIRVFRIKLPIYSKKGPLQEFIRYVLFTLKLIKLERKNKSDVVNAHSLHLLLAAVIIKWFIGAKVIYDAHELETEVAGAKGLKKRLAKIGEKFLIRFVDHTIVVSEGIGEWYRKEYNLSKVSVIRNIPNKQTYVEKTNVFREKFDIPEGNLIFLYQGVIAKMRSCDRLLEIFTHANSNRHLVMMGFGELEEETKEYAKSFENIHFHEAVSHNELPRYTGSADFGIHFMLVGDTLSHRFCMPNKLFQYMFAGLPVIFNVKAESMGNLLNQYDAGIGIDFENMSNEEIAGMINKVSADDLKSFMKKHDKIISDFSWENEASIYSKIYAFA